MWGLGGHKGRKSHHHRRRKHGHPFKWSHSMRKHHHRHHHHKDCAHKPIHFSSAILSGERRTDSLSASEYQAYSGSLHVDTKQCKACGKCIKACPAGAIEVLRMTAVINASLCVGCGACVDTCPTGAIMRQ